MLVCIVRVMVAEFDFFKLKSSTAKSVCSHLSFCVQRKRQLICQFTEQHAEKEDCELSVVLKYE